MSSLKSTAFERFEDSVVGLLGFFAGKKASIILCVILCFIKVMGLIFIPFFAVFSPLN